MKPLHELCIPRDSVFDETKRDDTLDLTNLIDGNIDTDTFIKETHVTQGMEQLIESAFKRFKRRGASGIIKLSQAMGGGKTHSMIVAGLLAMHPYLRKKILGGKFDDDQLGKIKVVSFTGRESDARYGIWGAIAEQLGKKDVFKDYYSPLQAPGQSAWINLLRGEPLLILLDELPPYLDDARSKTIGNSDLSAITTTALSNLFTAINKEELSNVCLVISDLKAAYEKGGELLQSSFRELDGEVSRSSKNIEPVSSTSDEVYSVLKTKLFEKLPPEDEIIKVAEGYKKSVEEAKQMGFTNMSPEKIFVGAKDSYPFHPSIKDLYARFRENQGFQQTRGLIRLMRHIVAQLYEGDNPKAKAKYMIGVHDFDLNDAEMYSKVKEIKPALDNAITHDIASNGKSVAEYIDAEHGTTITQDLAKLILVSSLADIPNALLGLSLPELIGYICEPGRQVAQAKYRLEDFRTSAWYLYVDKDGKLHFRQTKNINAEINSLKDSYDNESAKKQIREFLGEKFAPSIKDCYQKVLVFPGLDEIEPTTTQVVLAITQPYPQEGGLHPDLKKLFEETPYKNRLLFLTGQRSTMQNLLDKAKEFRAINTIVNRMEYEDKVPPKDPQFQQATTKQEKARIALLSSAKETFVTLFYPVKDNKLHPADFLMEFTSNEFKGEDQIRKVLIERKKLETDVTGESFRKKCEDRLFTRKEMRWSEIKERAATNTAWQWHLFNALDDLKNEMIKKGIWRENGGYLEKGPFKETTTVLVQEVNRDEDTGETTLRLVPKFGDKIHYEVNAPATTGSLEVTNLNNFKTTDLRLSFLCVDSTGTNETGEPVGWTGKITLKYDFYSNSQGKTMMKVASAPPVEIRYTTDGSNPAESGALYEEDFEIPEGTYFVLAVGIDNKHNVRSDTLQVKVPQKTGPRPEIEVDKSKPLQLSRKERTSDTQQTYETINSLKKHGASISELSAVVDKDGSWAELSTDSETKLDPSLLEQQLESLRSIVAGEDSTSIIIEYGNAYFPTGQHFLDWLEDNQLELQKFKESEVIQ